MSCTKAVAGPYRHRIPLVGAEERLRREALAHLLRMVMRWFERARQRRDLAELDAHMLKDIGLTQEQVAREVRKPFWIE